MSCRVPTRKRLASLKAILTKRKGERTAAQGSCSLSAYVEKGFTGSSQSNQ